MSEHFAGRRVQPATGNRTGSSRYQPHRWRNWGRAQSRHVGVFLCADPDLTHTLQCLV